MVMFFIITLVIILNVTYQLYKHFFPSPNINPNGKYVLITGCSSGFGYTLAIELDKQGFNVFAGVRNLQNASALKQQLSSRSVVFILDITKQEDIDAAYTMVKEKTNTLHALVNNAGISRSNYIDWMTIEIMRKNMDVNFFGHVAVTKKFLPLLISKKNSRVINVSSISGFISFSSASAYSTSKYALESFSDCLRREMAPWGLRVSIIEPGAMRTSFLNEQETFSRKLWNELPSDIQLRWGEDFANKVIKQIVDNPFMNNAEDPLKAVRAIQHAVMNTNPRIRYRPGWQAKLIFTIFMLFPDWLVDQLVLAGSSGLIPAGIRNQLKD
jgi:NAD(P)-dependent dehydrogenase (short-subunit alcohol dehydrogenase family)